MPGAVKRLINRADAAEAEIRSIAKEAKAGVAQLSARCSLLEAAMRVIMKHDLLSEFSHELNHPPAAEAPAIANGEQK